MRASGYSRVMSVKIPWDGSCPKIYRRSFETWITITIPGIHSVLDTMFLHISLLCVLLCPIFAAQLQLQETHGKPVKMLQVGRLPALGCIPRIPDSVCWYRGLMI